MDTYIYIYYIYTSYVYNRQAAPPARAAGAQRWHRVACACYGPRRNSRPRPSASRKRCGVCARRARALDEAWIAKAMYLKQGELAEDMNQWINALTGTPALPLELYNDLPGLLRAREIQTGKCKVFTCGKTDCDRVRRLLSAHQAKTLLHQRSSVIKSVSGLGLHTRAPCKRSA